MSFRLHPRLAADCVGLGRFRLCRLLLMNDSRYPWCILVPERAGISEIFELSADDRHLLIDESARLAQGLTVIFRADKMNVAAIGNLVPQLHVHHVVRYQTDAAWPAPVWGKFNPIPYAPAQLRAVMAKIKAGLGDRGLID